MRLSVLLVLRCALLAAFAATGARAAAPMDLTLVPVVTGLDDPVAVRPAGDGSGQLFIVDRGGRILVLANGSVRATPFLDLSSVVDTGGTTEEGLLGLAFHPHYADNGYFYVNYTVTDGNRRTHVVRYRVSDADPNVADPASAYLVFDTRQPSANHNGGNILFGPDGYLYIGMGDGGAQYDIDALAQRRDMLLAKMLRVDVNSAAPTGSGEICGSTAHYGIPPDNPFVGTDGTCDEIWSIGWRNPWRFSFDRARGDLIVGDVGQDHIEEIDLEPAGLGGRNYGWSCREGSVVRSYHPCLPMALVNPILEYEHVGTRCAVIGGYRYRGHRLAGLDGAYLYADFCSGELWFAELSAAGNVLRTTLFADTELWISAFGEDEAGELYVVDLGAEYGGGPGGLHRIESPSAIFGDGFETPDDGAWDLPPRVGGGMLP